MTRSPLEKQWNGVLRQKMTVHFLQNCTNATAWQSTREEFIEGDHYLSAGEQDIEREIKRSLRRPTSRNIYSGREMLLYIIQRVYSTVYNIRERKSESVSWRVSWPFFSHTVSKSLSYARLWLTGTKDCTLCMNDSSQHGRGRSACVI